MRDIMLKKIRSTEQAEWIIVIAVLALLCIGAYVIDSIRHDPVFMLKMSSIELNADETVEITYSSDKSYLDGRTFIPVMHFSPDETKEYTFIVSDIDNSYDDDKDNANDNDKGSDDDRDACLILNVIDEDFADYITVGADDDQGDSDKAGIQNVLSGTALLNADKDYYVIVEAAGISELSEFAGSFSITVAEAKKQEQPPVLEEGESVRISAGRNDQKAVLFIPDETGYYRFDSTIAGRKTGYGNSEITSVTDEDGGETDLHGGICHLESGKNYYVWVGIDDMDVDELDVLVSCSSVEHTDAEGRMTVNVSDDAVIEYTALSDIPIAVWSVSDGDPYARVFDMEGFPVNTDNDSGGSFSDNEHDFALVLVPEQGKKYIIFVGGSFDNCEVNIADYIGDGTSLGPDTVFADSDADADSDSEETDTKGFVN